jgi:hypothetical protein
MSYSNDGGSGWQMPFCFPTSTTGSGGMSIVVILAVVFFGLLLLGNGGGNGLFGGGGNTAAATADLVGQRAVAEKVSSIGTGVDAVAGIATANGVKIETVKDLSAAGFAGVQRDMCAAFANSANLANSNHADLSRQNTDLRFQLSECCCDNKAMTAETQRQMADGFCRLGHQYEVGNAAVLRAIADLGCALNSKLDAQRMADMQAENAKLSNQISQLHQDARIAAMLQQYGRGGCNPCAPCCPPNVCTELQEALVQNWINKTLTPATTTP